ncbi:hypothetical protein J3R30DRAFT_3448542 [Lentinula aciculospora]|uniref:Glycopeptide n=1 Tax=Lentinula aciculospora TaxID=153920 RepID=A0A9W9AIL9_9AGAR|nr:hypothetical protein J3R30DRAFT_3448542 [Lentinula aciculospora]
MSPTFFFVPLFVLSFFSTLVNAETHIVKFDNQCGYGTPQLIQGNDVLTSTQYTFNESYSGVAYLQTGNCGFNGEYCGIVEMTLDNSVTSGGGSSADISYIPPLAYSVPYKFEFYGGCDGNGASCTSSDCSEAFYESDQTYVQVACQTDDVNILITFCESGSTGSSDASSATAVSGSGAVDVMLTSTSSAPAQVETSSTLPTTTVVDGSTSSVVSSIATALSGTSSSSSRRCNNRKRRSSDLSESLKAHRRRSPLSRL